MSRIESPFGAQVFRQVQVREQIETLSTRLFTGKQFQQSGESPVEWHESAGLRDRMGQLAGVNGGLNALGLSLRQAHGLMDTLNRYLGLLQSALEGARDAGVPPPTPELAAERDRHVQQYNAFLQQMNDMVNDNRDELTRTLTGDPGQVSGAGDLEIVVTENGLTQRVRAQELHTGPTGLNIHQMPNQPTAADLESVALNLNAARGTLQMKQQLLDWDSAQVARKIGMNTDLSAKLGARAADLETANMDETAAGIQSLQVQQSLMTSTSKVVYDLRSSLLEILR